MTDVMKEEDSMETTQLASLEEMMVMMEDSPLEPLLVRKCSIVAHMKFVCFYCPFKTVVG